MMRQSFKPYVNTSIARWGIYWFSNEKCLLDNDLKLNYFGMQYIGIGLAFPY